MRCPRCQAAITTSPDAAGALRCPSCGAKLVTLAAAAARPPAADPEPSPPATAAPVPAVPKPVPSDLILAELRALRDGQEEILEWLRAEGGHGDRHDDGPEEAPTQTAEDDLGFVPPLRTKGRKSIVLIDDDPDTRAGAQAELERADVPVRAFADGQSALSAMAEEKPDLIVIELDLRGAMAGKDVINVIKAAMEWVDIPIILYTRQAVESQKEARTVHGADEFVLKSAGAASLVTRCIALFRRI